LLRQKINSPSRHHGFLNVLSRLKSICRGSTFQLRNVHCSRTVVVSCPAVLNLEPEPRRSSGTWRHPVYPSVWDGSLRLISAHSAAVCGG